MSKPKDSSLTSRYATKVVKDTMLPKDSPKAQNKEKKTHIFTIFCFFIPSWRGMMVLLHFDFIIGHKRRLKTKRKKNTNPNPKDLRSQIHKMGNVATPKAMLSCRCYRVPSHKDDGQINHSDFHLTS